MKTKQRLFLIILFGLITIVLWQFELGRLILYPFTILGTWFHEMGHGLAAIMLGGTFHELEIQANGSGVARYSGSLLFGGIGNGIVAAAGPLGPTIAGTVFMGFSQNNKSVKFILAFISIVMLISVVIWLRSFVGIAIVGAIGVGILYASIRATPNFQQALLQFLAVQAFASIYLSMDYLFSPGGSTGMYSYISDTGQMENYLFLPYWFWGGLIVLISLLLFYSSVRGIIKGR